MGINALVESGREAEGQYAKNRLINELIKEN